VLIGSTEAQVVKKHVVKFKARKSVKVRTAVKFQTSGGKKIAFTGHKSVKKKVPIRFRAKDR